MVLLSGIILLVLGLLSIFARDLLWEFTEWQNRLKGVVSERTSEWDNAAGVGGVLVLILGLFVIFPGFSIS